MEWTNSQIISTIIGIIVVGIILYFIVSKVFNTAPPTSDIPTQIIPIAIAVSDKFKRWLVKV